MDVHVVRPNDGWSMCKLGEGFADRIPGATASDQPDFDADINFWVNHHLMFMAGMPKTQCDVAYFAARSPMPAIGERFDRVANIADWCVASCGRTALLLPDGKTSVIPGGADDIYVRSGPIRLGVACGKHPPERMRLIDELDKIHGIELQVTGGSLDEEEMVTFYETIDYLLILPQSNSGPLPVFEAMCMGKPVIAPDVGWSWDYPVIKYREFKDLRWIIHGLVAPRNSWVTSMQRLISLFDRLIDERSSGNE